MCEERTTNTVISIKSIFFCIFCLLFRGGGKLLTVEIFSSNVKLIVVIVVQGEMFC